MNLSELQKRSHATAVAKGWHESDELGSDGKPTARQKLAWLALVTDELDEAANEPSPREMVYLDDNGKPCGVAVEYADALIRLLDMAGACGWTICDVDETFSTTSGYRSRLVECIRKGESEETQSEVASELFASIVCDYLNEADSANSHDDLDRAINEKMAYNSTRPYRHGGKLA